MQDAVNSTTDKRTSDGGASLIDYFLHPSFAGSPDITLRARILIATLCAIIGIVVTAILLLLVTPVAPATRLVGILVDMVLIAVSVYLLQTLKRRGNYAFCTATTLAMPLTAAVCGICVSGGIVHSPVTQLLVIPPLMAYFFSSMRGGNKVTVITATAIFLLFALQQYGIEFPQTIEAERQGIAQALVLLVNFTALAGLAFFYELTSAALRRERDHEHEKVVKLAHTDALTGLANRRIFDATLTERIAKNAASDSPRHFSLCYLDLDGFKSINDRHGHDVGDQVLRAVSIRLRSALRGADLIGRHGGDEFMLLLDDLGPGRALEVMAQRFRLLIEEPIETSAGLLCVGASLGFAVYPNHATSTEPLKKAADKAMYVAKRQRLGWRLYDAAVDNVTGASNSPR